MKLKDWLIKNRMDPDEFAFKNNISVASVYRYLNGCKMHFNRAKAIEKFTNNEVTLEELMKYGKSRK